MSNGMRIRIWGLIIIGLIIYVVAQFGVGLYTDLLWFAHLGFETVLLTGLWARLGIGVVFAAIFAVIFLINTLLARRQSIHNVLFFSDEVLVAQKFILWAVLGATLFLAWVMGSLASAQWVRFLEFFNQQPFNLADPIFNRDVSFYIFSLPVYRFLQGWLVAALIFSLVASLAIYAAAQQNNLAEGRVVVLPHVQLHLSILGAIIFLVFAFGRWLSLFELMYSPRGVAFGPSYTDVTVSVPALWTMIGVAGVTALILLLNAFIRRPQIAFAAIAVWLLVSLVGNSFLPNLIQRYIVEPNELAREATYIQKQYSFYQFCLWFRSDSGAGFFRN